MAEGVENNETRQRLVEAGCRVGQGWLYAKPMPADEFAQWHSRHTAEG